MKVEVTRNPRNFHFVFDFEISEDEVNEIGKAIKSYQASLQQMEAKFNGPMEAKGLEAINLMMNEFYGYVLGILEETEECDKK